MFNPETGSTFSPTLNPINLSLSKTKSWCSRHFSWFIFKYTSMEQSWIQIRQKQHIQFRINNTTNVCEFHNVKTMWSFKKSMWGLFDTYKTATNFNTETYMKATLYIIQASFKIPYMWHIMCPKGIIINCRRLMS